MTNHSKDQDMQTTTQLQDNINVLACGSVFSCLFGFFLATQHSRDISGVHGFPGLTAILCSAHAITLKFMTREQTSKPQTNSFTVAVSGLVFPHIIT